MIMIVNRGAVRVLLTEGSSLTSREVVTSLGPAGYHLEVLDPDQVCIARFSRWVRTVHRCPPASDHPLEYLAKLKRVAAERSIDVVLPTHEQAWLLSAGRGLLGPDVRVALADAGAFARVQSKIAFARVLDELELPQPAWRLVRSESDLEDVPFPYWLKRPFSTAGQGVRAATDARSRAAAVAELLDDQTEPVIAQQPATGEYGQVQALFDMGRLVAVHTSVQRGSGVGGSAAARVSVDHPAPRRHVAVLGEALGWHGGLTLDYLHIDGVPSYIECNPRTVEPGNAAASGVNLADLQVRLTRGEPVAGPVTGRPGVRTHGTLALLLGAAARGDGRRALVHQLGSSLRHTGLYADSSEQLTPVRRDPPSLIPLTTVFGRLLASPHTASQIAAHAVGSYSIAPAAIATVTAAVMEQSA
jgi:hypothetical protein